MTTDELIAKIAELEKENKKLKQENERLKWILKTQDQYGIYIMKVKIGPYTKSDKIKRRVKIEIDNYDVWNMDHTLSMIILPMLKIMRDGKAGAPFVDDEDAPENIRSTAAKPKKNEWDTDEYHVDRWYWILDEMIWAFEQIQDFDNDKEFFKDGFDKEGYAKHQERIDNGLKMFGKYYRALWT